MQAFELEIAKFDMCIDMSNYSIVQAKCTVSITQNCAFSLDQPVHIFRNVFFFQLFEKKCWKMSKRIFLPKSLGFGSSVVGSSVGRVSVFGLDC